MARGRRQYQGAVFGDQLRFERRNCVKPDGYPFDQADAASLIGVSRETWCRWETDRTLMSQVYYREWQEKNEPYRMFDYQPDGSAKLRAFKPLPHPPGPDELDVRAPISNRALDPGTPAPTPTWPADVTQAEIDALVSEHRARVAAREHAELMGQGLAAGLADLPDASELEAPTE